MHAPKSSNNLAPRSAASQDMGMGGILNGIRNPKQLRPAMERQIAEKPKATDSRDDMLSMIRSHNFNLRPADERAQSSKGEQNDPPSPGGPGIVPSVAEIMERARKIREAVEDSDDDDDDDDFDDY